MMGLRDCCQTIISALPDPTLPFLPSFALATLVAAFLLLYLYKKQTKLPLKIILTHIVKKLVYLLPNTEHSESEACANPDCVRCRKYEELKVQIVERYKEVVRTGGTVSARVEEAVVGMQDVGKEDQGFNSKEQFKGFQKPTLFCMKLPAHPYWTCFPVFQKEIELLKINLTVIVKEFQTVFEAVQRGDNWGWKVNDITKGHWCIFPFIDQGSVNESNCARCPNVAALLGSLGPIMKDCVFGNACFSILYPDSYIEPHCGPSNLRLRCHLGLSVPSGCWLEVAGEQQRWKTGEAVVFDDSYEHSASFSEQHHSAQAFPRAVLLLDFWHPDVTPQEKQVLLKLLAP